MVGHFIITSLFIYGIKASFSEGMILEPIKIRLMWLLGIDSNNIRKVNIANKVRKVLFDCTPCMASFYGSFSYCVFLFHSREDLIHLPVFVFCLCGFNYLINRLLNR